MDLMGTRIGITGRDRADGRPVEGGATLGQILSALIDTAADALRRAEALEARVAALEARRPQPAGSATTTGPSGV